MELQDDPPDERPAERSPPPAAPSLNVGAIERPDLDGPLDLVEGDVPRWMHNPRTRRLLLGDWHPLVRDPIDVLRFALLVGAGMLLLLDKHLEAAPLVTVLIVLLPRLLDLPRPLDLAVVVGMSLQAWGNLFDLFDRYGWYDDVVHFMLPMLTCAASYIALAQFQTVPRPGNYLRHGNVGTGLITFLIGLGYAALYEIYEGGADWIFHLQPPLQDSLADTDTDLLFGALGSAVGAAALIVWYMRGYGALRRLPPDAVVAQFGNAAARRKVRQIARTTGPRSPRAEPGSLQRL